MADAEQVVDVVAALDDEVAADGARAPKAGVGARRGVELGLDVGVGDEEEAERIVREGGLWGCRLGGGAGRQEAGTARGEQACGAKPDEERTAAGAGDHETLVSV